MTRLVLAYSGGLATSVAIPWLADTYEAEIVAVTIDLGQGKEVLEEIRDRALATGALRAHVVDVRDEFAREYLLRALKAGILWRDGSSMAAALAHPMIAQKLVEIANIEQARAVAHGDAGGRAAPIDRTIRALDPALSVFAPAGEWKMTPAQQAEYAQQRNLTLPAPMSGLGERAASRPAAGLPEEAAYVDIAFENGAPTGVNGVAMPLLDLIGSLGIIAGAHGVASLAGLQGAHRALEQAALGGAAEAASSQVAGRYLRLLRDGSWFSPARRVLDASVDAAQQRVAGVVRLKLFKGDCAVVDCRVSTASAPKTIALAKTND